MKKISFLESLRQKGWKEGAEGWIPPAPGSVEKARAKKAKARVCKPTGEGMNSLEARYVVEVLEKEIERGEVIRWHYEPVKLRLAPKTTYTPDFMVIKEDGEIGFREVKGFMREDAAVKFKWARELYPYFSFQMITRKGGKWKEALPAVGGE